MARTSRKRLTITILPIMCLLIVPYLRPAPGGSDDWKTWPPRNYLMKALVKSVEAALKTYHPDTGRFGTDPWICRDQEVLLPLAAAWSLKDSANPYYHDKKLLEVISKGGEALVDDQDSNGMWLFRKKDNSTWGQIHMPWTYSRWIRAYVLVKDALSKAAREKWEKGLKLGFSGIRAEQMKAKVQNIPCHHAMALYIAGEVFKNEDWKNAARDYQKKVMEEQDPEGYWSENSGPVVSYNMVYLEALGVYYDFSKDPSVPEALTRSVKFHSAALWSDGTSVSTIDERVIYHKTINTGNVGFTWSPQGRGFILGQLFKESEGGQKLISGDYAAQMLLYAGKGDVSPLPAGQAQGVSVIGRNNAVIVRNKPWEWAFSGYTTKPIQNRWIQDRQNFFDLFHSDFGMIAGGGNTKLQPYWSTFTVGDPAFLRHKEGDEDPNFLPKTDLVWTPSQAMITSSGNPTKMELKYGEIECSVSLEVLAGGKLAILTYQAPPGKKVEAHLPLMNVANTVNTANGMELVLSEKELVMDQRNIGGFFDFGRLRVEIPSGVSLRWPCRQHNPYTKDGHSELADAKLVLVMPFDRVNTYRILVSVYE